MAVESDEDRAIFFDADDFAVPATIQINGGGTLEVTGIFNSPNLTRGVRQDNGYAGQAEVSGQVTSYRVRTSEIPGVKNGRATLTIEGVEYSAHDVKHDGTGTTTITLKRA